MSTVTETRAAGVGAIVVAGGRGERFGGSRPKTLSMLGGRPVVGWAVDAFWRRVARVVLVAPAGLERTMASAAGVPVVTVTGGARRQDSVRAGLAALGPDVDVVLVHDAARPLVPAATIDAVLAAVRADGAAVPIETVHSTVKRVGADGFVEATVPRDALGLAQTPQGARRAWLEEALARADGDVTDESAALEAIGVRVRAVPVAADNRKITTPDDLALLERTLAARAIGACA